MTRLTDLVYEYVYDHKHTSPAVYEYDDFGMNKPERVKDTEGITNLFNNLVILPFPMPARLVRWITNKQEGSRIFNILPVWFV